MKIYWVYLVVVPFAFLFSTHSSQLTNVKSLSVQEINRDIELQSNLSHKSLDSIRQSIDSLKQEMIELHHVIKNANDVLTTQNNLINSFGAIYIILTICITLITIGFPLLTYYSTIAPSKKDLQDGLVKIDNQLREVNTIIENRFKDIDKNLSERLDDFLSKNIKQKIDDAITNLKSDDNILQSNAINLLSKLTLDNFREEHTFRICKILQTVNFNEEQAGTLSSILVGKRGDDVETFFRTLPTHSRLLEMRNIRYDAYRFFLLNTKNSDNISFVTDIVIATSNPTEELCKLLDWISSSSFEGMLLLLNNQRLIDCSQIGKQLLFEKFEEIKNIYIKDNEKNKKIENTLLFRLREQMTEAESMKGISLSPNNSPTS